MTRRSRRCATWAASARSPSRTPTSTPAWPPGATPSAGVRSTSTLPHAEWVQYRTPALRLWSGTTHAILPGVTLINTGGHFEGSTALHWAGGAQGRGLLLSGDSLTVVMDRRYLSFMYSYPNLIPLPESAVRRIVEAVRPFAFERIYGAWDGRQVAAGGKDAVERSAARYIRAIGGGS